MEIKSWALQVISGTNVLNWEEYPLILKRYTSMDNDPIESYSRKDFRPPAILCIWHTRFFWFSNLEFTLEGLWMKRTE